MTLRDDDTVAHGVSGGRLLFVPAIDFNVSHQVAPSKMFSRGNALSVCWGGDTEFCGRRIGRVVRGGKEALNSSAPECAVDVGAGSSGGGLNNGIESIDDLHIGMVLDGVIKDIRPFDLLVRLGTHVHGKVHVSGTARYWS